MKSKLLSAAGLAALAVALVAFGESPEAGIATARQMEERDCIACHQTEGGGCTN